MSLLTATDFTGIFAVSQNKYDSAKLQLYIDQLEESYLEELMGCDLYALYKADLDVNNIPQTQRFIDIFNKFCYDTQYCVKDCEPNYFDYPLYFLNYCFNYQNKSRGIKDMLRGFMFAEYTRDQQITNSSIGANKSTGVASSLVANSAQAIRRHYNDSIKDYWNIQYYIVENESTYPEFKGVKKEYISIL